MAVIQAVQAYLLSYDVNNSWCLLGKSENIPSQTVRNYVVLKEWQELDIFSPCISTIRINVNANEQETVSLKFSALQFLL